MRLAIEIFIAVMMLAGCASTINTSGRFAQRGSIERMLIFCTTPNEVESFSNDLLASLKDQIQAEGISVQTKLVNEMKASIDTTELSVTTEDKMDLVLNIMHTRVTYTYGKPSNTLMTLQLYDTEKGENVWVGKIYTQGTNVTGVGNPTKVAAEIVEKLKADGLKA